MRVSIGNPKKIEQPIIAGASGLDVSLNLDGAAIPVDVTVTVDTTDTSTVNDILAGNINVATLAQNNLWSGTTGGFNKPLFAIRCTDAASSIKLGIGFVQDATNDDFAFMLVLNPTYGGTALSYSAVPGLTNVEYAEGSTVSGGPYILTDGVLLYHSDVIRLSNDGRAIDFSSIELGDGFLIDGNGSNEVVLVVIPYGASGRVDAKLTVFETVTT